MDKPVSDLPVMKGHCKTCPFKPNKDGHPDNPRLANRVTSRTLFQGQQICHHHVLLGEEPTHRCKGSYDHNKEIYDRMGLGDLLK